MSDNNSAKKAPVAVALASLILGILIAQWLPSDLLGLRGGNDVTSAAAVAGESGSSDQLWTCGMHPHVIQDEPGQCPICGMDLTPMKGGSSSAGSSDRDHSHQGDPISVAAQWTCPDHAMIVEDEPGQCPIDGLELVAQKPEGGDGMGIGVGSAVAIGDSSVHQNTSVVIDPTVVQNMNVRIQAAQRRDLTRPIRTVGYLEFDQQRMVTVTTKYSGWVEKVNVNYVGEKVKRGQPLFEIYSPELVQTEQELLSALEFAREMEGAPEDARDRAWSMVDSARTRLGYWDIDPEQISQLEETGEVFRTLEVSAPAGGLVMKRMAGLEGMAVQPGMELFHIADLSSLWLSIELFEDQLASVREGTEAEINLSYFPGETFRGRVRFLEPELSEKTRTMRAKIEVPNRGGRLRKGMYATVDLKPVEVRNALTVPLQSVLRTGQRNVVVVALGEGRFAPRDVVLGHEAEGFAQVISGLEDGAEVVTSAQFLLDSESKLREAVQKMVAERMASGSPEAAQPSHSDPDSHSDHPGH